MKILIAVAIDFSNFSNSYLTTNIIFNIFYSPKTVLYLIVVGGEQPSRGMPGGAIPSEVKAIG